MYEIIQLQNILEQLCNNEYSNNSQLQVAIKCIFSKVTFSTVSWPFKGGDVANLKTQNSSDFGSNK